MKLSIIAVENFYQLVKYGLISIVGYVSILALMFVFVTVLNFNQVWSFVGVYLLAYLAEYFINLKYLFYKNHSWAIVLKFVLHILFFIGCGSVVFRLFIDLNFNYLVATILTAIALLPVRFFAHKLMVFR